MYHAYPRRQLRVRLVLIASEVNVKLRAWFIMALLVSACVTSATAKPVKSEKENVFRIAGQPQECTDFRGRRVLTMQVADLGDVGRAWVVNTIPYIIMDPELLRTLPPKLQLFFYSHECAHHVLGHWYNRTIYNERDADCWAIKRGRDMGVLTRQEVVNFAPWLAKSGGSAWGHLPGPERAKHLLTCFDED